MMESVNERSAPWLMFRDVGASDVKAEGVKENRVPGRQPGDDLSPASVLLAGAVQGADKLRGALRSIDDRMLDVQSGKASVDALDETLDDARLAALDLGARLKGLASSDVPIPGALREQIAEFLRESPERKPGALPDDPGIRQMDDAPKVDAGNPDAAPQTDTGKEGDDKVPTDGEIWDKLIAVIGHMKEFFLKIFSEAAKKYLEFSKALADIMSKLSGWIENQNDGKEVDLDVGKLKEALQPLLNKYKLPGKEGVLWPTQTPGDGPIEGGAKEDAEKWAKELGLPEGSVKEQPEGSGKFVVVVDLSTIETMINTLPQGDGNGKKRMTTQELEIWRTGFTGQESVVKTQVQGLSQRYATANATNENLVKLLSGAILAMSESNKGFFR
ncbi:hypothetical protein AB870_12320 [Pandoraea faecigallinarum]|uniref:Translocator protein BipD n=1 Tax=Pandoraea faecigallinarum TaxID=656179 RepID=A0A0H3WRB5_9BURK|nr:IpaD/SipD/SspD family type III secretion system needle tip protein [Pandoraea faecigallinarum]AKM30724.1 hypothetical protein AB870_12320 [Pandoraea faecigallinarum]